MTTALGYSELLNPRVYIEADGDLAFDITTNITKFEFSDDEKKANEIHITVANPYHRFTDDPRFAQGINFRCCWGYLNDMSKVYSVAITKAKAEFKVGMPTIELVGFDARYDMTKGSHPTNWGPVSSSQVARDIAEAYGFLVDIDESDDARKQDRIQSSSTTDIAYLQALAEEINFDCFVDDDMLHFHKKRYDEPPGLEFVYFVDALGTMFEFSPEVNMNKPSKVGKTGSDPKKSSTEARKDGSDTDGQSKAGRYNLGRPTSPGARMVPHTTVTSPEYSPISHSSPETSKKVIEAHSKALSAKIDMKAVKANLKVIGTPRLRAKMMVRLTNVGQTYSGNWRVASTKHTIVASGSIYVVEAKLTRNATNKGKDANKTKNGEGGGSNDKSAQPSYHIQKGKNASQKPIAGVYVK